jgi:hypothetical protein
MSAWPPGVDEDARLGLIAVFEIQYPRTRSR